MYIFRPFLGQQNCSYATWKTSVGIGLNYFTATHQFQDQDIEQKKSAGDHFTIDGRRIFG